MAVNAAEVYVAMVFAIVFHELNGDTALSQLVTLPVFPLNVNKPDVLPEHIVVPPDTVPATEGTSTVTVVAVAVKATQPLPSVT